MRRKNTDIEGKEPGSGLPSISIDWQRYEAYLAESQMSDEDKRAFVETLWQIMLAFVDLGFGLDPTSQTCGEGAKPFHFTDSDMLKLETSSRTNQPISNHEAEGGQQ